MRKPGPLRDIPPPLELQCLKILWSIRQGTVKDVRQALAVNRQLAYTTVMTILERLTRKGGVARQKVGRSFVYAPVLDRELLRQMALKELLDDFFDGSEQALRAYLDRHVGSAPPAPDHQAEAPRTAPPPQDDEYLDAALL